MQHEPTAQVLMQPYVNYTELGRGLEAEYLSAEQGLNQDSEGSCTWQDTNFESYCIGILGKAGMASGMPTVCNSRADNHNPLKAMHSLTVDITPLHSGLKSIPEASCSC